jgi:nucleotide-binding universal stress UspA family protein
MKSILVHLTGTAGDHDVLAMALRVGRLFRAHLNCTHTVPEDRLLLRRAVTVEMSAAMFVVDAVKSLMVQAEARAVFARNAFATFCKENSITAGERSRQITEVSAEFHESIGDPLEGPLRQARFHDLVIVANASRQRGIVPEIDLSGLVVEAGRPVFLAPPAASHEPLKSVAIAWKTGAESARAVTAAMPILRKTKRVHILGAFDLPQDEAQCRNDLELVERQLRLYDIDATALPVVTTHSGGCDSILAAVQKLGSDLLVMGAYGHSRVRELVLGGFTQQVLDGVEAPVFLLH